MGLLKLSRGNVESCYFSKASDQGQLGELVAKLCYREDKSYIWLGLKKKKKRCFLAFGVDLILPSLGWPGNQDQQ